MTRRVKLIALLMVGVAVPAFAADERGEPAGASDGEVLRGNVLVWQDAAFYVEPSDAATTLHAASLAGVRKDSPGAVVPMHVVGTTRDFVEVEAVAGDDCAWAHLATSDDLARLHLFVKRSALAPVLVEPYTHSYDNGSRIALRPGVALVPASGGKYLAALRGGTVAVELPATAVGHAYTPDKTKPVTTISDREYVVAAKTALALGETSLVLEGQRATAIEPHGASTLLLFRARCVALDVLAPAKAVHAVDDDEASIAMGGGAGVLALREHDYIPAGTPLATPGGRPIAAAAKPIYLAAPPRGKTACVDRHVTIEVDGGDALAPTDGDDRVRVCAPAGRVVHERMRSANSANGATGR
jgi:hypothetical protein